LSSAIPKDIMLKLNEKIPERTLRFDLTKLKNLGFLENSGHANATLWFVSRSYKT